MNHPPTASTVTTGIVKERALKPSWNHGTAEDDDSSISDHGNGYKMTLQQLLGGGVGTVSPIKGQNLDTERLHHSLRRWKSMEVDKDDNASVVSEAPRRRVVGRTKSQETEDLQPKMQSSRRCMPRRTRSFDDSTPFGMEKPSTFIAPDPEIEKTIQIMKQELIHSGDNVRGLSALVNSMIVKDEGTSVAVPLSSTSTAVQCKMEEDSSESGLESIASDFDILTDDDDEHKELSALEYISDQFNRPEKTLPLDDVLSMQPTNADLLAGAKSAEIIIDTNTTSVEITFDSKGKSEEFKASALFMDSDPSLDPHDGANRYPNHLIQGKPKPDINEVAELQESLRRWKTMDLPTTTVGVQGGNPKPSTSKIQMKTEPERMQLESSATNVTSIRPTLQQPEWSQRHLMAQQSLDSNHQQLLPQPSLSSNSLSMRRGLIKRGESVRGLIAVSVVKQRTQEPVEKRQEVPNEDDDGMKNNDTIDDNEEPEVRKKSNNSVHARIALIESKLQSERMNLPPQTKIDPVDVEIQLLSKILEKDDIVFSLNEKEEDKSDGPPQQDPSQAARPIDMPIFRDVDDFTPALTRTSIKRSSENDHMAIRMQSSRHLLMTQGSFDSRMPKRASSHRNLFPQKSFDANTNSANNETKALPAKRLAARRGLIKRGESVRGLLAVPAVSETIKDTVTEQDDIIEEDESEHYQNTDQTDAVDFTDHLKDGSKIELCEGRPAMSQQKLLVPTDAEEVLNTLASEDISRSMNEAESKQPVEQAQEGAPWKETFEEVSQTRAADFILAPSSIASRMASRVQSSRHLLTTQGSFDSRMPNRASSHRNLFPQKSLDAKTHVTSKETAGQPPTTLAARRGLINRGESVRGLIAFSAMKESAKDTILEKTDTIEEEQPENRLVTNQPTSGLKMESNEIIDEGSQGTVSESLCDDSEDTGNYASTDAALESTETPIEISLDSFLSPQSTLVHIDEMHILTNKGLECDDSNLNSLSELGEELSVKGNMYSKYRQKLMESGSVGSVCSPKPDKAPSIKSPMVPSIDNLNVSGTLSIASGSSDVQIPSRKEGTPIVVRSSDWAHLVPVQLRSHQSFHQISSKITVPTSIVMDTKPPSSTAVIAEDRRNSLTLEVVEETESIQSVESDPNDFVEKVDQGMVPTETMGEKPAPIDVPEQDPAIVNIEILESDTLKSPTPALASEKNAPPEVTVAAEKCPSIPPAVLPQRSFDTRRRPMEPSAPGGSFDASRLRRSEAAEAPSSRQLVRRGLITRGHSVRVLTLLPATKPEPDPPRKEEEVVGNEDDYAPLPSELTVVRTVETSPTPATPSSCDHNDDDVPWEELMASLKKASDQLLFPEMAATDPYKSYVTLGHLSQNLMDCYGSPQEEYFSPRKSPRKTPRTMEITEASEDGDDDDVYLETSLLGSSEPKKKIRPPPPPVLAPTAPHASEVITPALAEDHPLSPPSAVVAEDHSQRSRSTTTSIGSTKRSSRKGALRLFLQTRRAQNPQPQSTMTIWTDEDRLDEDLESRIGEDGSTFLEI